MAGLREILGAVPMIGGALASAIPGVGAVAGPLLGAAGSAIFNAASVERERAWSEKMYNKYNSPQALVRQYQEAGINPALMFGQSAIPAPTTSTAAQAPENPFGDVVGMMGALMQLDLLGEQKRGMQISNASGEFELGLRRTFAYDEYMRVLDRISSEIGSNKARAALDYATSNLRVKEGEVLDLDKQVKQWTSDFIQEFHISPDLAGQLARSLGSLAGTIISQWLKSPLSMPASRAGGR